MTYEEPSGYELAAHINELDDVVRARITAMRDHINALDEITRRREQDLEERLVAQLEEWVRGILTDEEWETTQRLIADGLDITTAVRSARILGAPDSP